MSSFYQRCLKAQFLPPWPTHCQIPHQSSKTLESLRNKPTQFFTLVLIYNIKIKYFLLKLLKKVKIELPLKTSFQFISIWQGKIVMNH